MANNQSVRRHLDAFTRGRIIGKLEEGRSVTSQKKQAADSGEIARHTTQVTGRPISRFTVARRLHGGGLFARRPVRCVPLTLAHRRRRFCGAGNTGIGETMNGDEYSLQMRADSV
ncbi:hypothetical protein TNCV_4651021 [Trichonephila clavipes]|nr:hypothetical protein TNCV_4651021 [Trichonephila clavipes]